MVYNIYNSYHAIGIETDERRVGMKATGIVRRVDELGRIVLPIELRRTMGISERDELEIFLDGERIVLRKCGTVCAFCGSDKELVSYRERYICRECIGQLTDR